MRRVHVLIKGRVHGVFFRAGIEEKAKKLHLKGYVRNIPEGVEAVFEGEDKNIKDMLEFCVVGPKGAKITSIEIKEEPFQDEFDTFTVES